MARTFAIRMGTRFVWFAIPRKAKSNLRSTNSYGIPEFADRGFYVDMPFSCKACGKPQLWTATQQKWWYESAKGDVWTIAVLCRPCRLRERATMEEARKTHLEGLAKKARRET